MASTEDAYNQSVEAIKEEFEGRQATISSLYEVERKSIVENENLKGQAQSEALKQWQSRKEHELLESMRQEEELVAESKKSRDYIYNQALEQSNKLVEKTGFRFDILKQKIDTYNSDLDFMDKNLADTTAKGIQKFNEASVNADLMSKDILNILNGVDTNTAQTIHNFFTLANEARNKGVTVSDDMRQQLDIILAAFEGLPAETQEAGKQLLAGLMQGMADQNGNLIDTTDMSCQDVINAARDAFEIHSPSRVFAEMGNYIGEGLSQGIEESMPKVTESLKKIIHINSAKMVHETKPPKSD